MKAGHPGYYRKPRKSLVRRAARRVAHRISKRITDSLDPDNPYNYGGARRHRTRRGRKSRRGHKTRRGRKTRRH
jgi:hypothetical protein